MTHKIEITVAGRAGHIPAFPEPEGSDLKRHLRQALASMSLNPPPIKDFDKASSREFEAISKHRSALTGETDFKPFVYGNDVDAVDVATRVAMAKFLNGANVLGNLTEHTRTLRLYPRPVVAFQVQTFLCSRPNRSAFTDQLASSQSKWFREQLQPIEFKVQFENCTLGAALSSASEGGSDSSNPTDESGEESEREDGGGSSSSSYSSLDEFVVDMMNSDIKGDVQDPDKPDQISEIDEHSIYRPPDSLQLPPDMVQSDNNQFADSDSSSSQDNPTSPDSSDEELPLSVRMRIAQNMSMSGVDTDQDLDSSVYDSDNMYAMTKQNRRDSNDVDSEAGSRGGRTSPTFMDKFNSLFRSDSSDSSAPTTPTKTKPKPSILRGIMDLALDTAKEPIGSPTSLSSLDPNGYSPSVKSDPGPNRSRMGSGMGLPTRKKKTSSPLTRDTRRSLVERTSLIRHHSTKKPEKRSSLTSERPNSEDQLFLKEIVRGVLEGNNVGWLNWSRLKRLMQNENLRAQVISQLYPQDSAVTGDYIEDVKVNKAVYKGLCSVLKAVLAGLEYSFDNHNAGGMASAFALLEIASTHYFGKEPELTQKGDGRHRGGSLKSGAPHGQYALDELLSQQQGGHHHPGVGGSGGGGGGGMLTIASRPSESHSLNEDNFIAAIGWQKSESVSSCSTSTEEGGVKVHSSNLEDNRNDSAYELIDESEIPIGSSTGAGVHGAVGIAAGIAVTGTLTSPFCLCCILIMISKSPCIYIHVVLSRRCTGYILSSCHTGVPLSELAKSITLLPMAYYLLGDSKDITQGDSEYVPQGYSKDIKQGGSEYVTQVDSKDITQGDSEYVTQGDSKDIKQGGSEYVPQGDCKDITQGGSEYVTQGDSKDIKQGGSEYVTLVDSKDITQGDSEYVTQVDTKDITQGDSEYVTQVDSKDITQGDSEYVTQGDSKDITQGDSEYVPQGNCKDITQGGSEYVTQGDSKDIKQDGSEYVTQGDSKDITQGVSKYVTQGDSKYIAQGDSEYATQGESKDITQGDSEYVPQGDCKDITQGGSEYATQGDSKDIKQDGSEYVTQGDSKDITQGVSKYVTQGDSKYIV
nr:MAP kinase-activating death domain protein-like [Lytechinus pictus]